MHHFSTTTNRFSDFLSLTLNAFQALYSEQRTLVRTRALDKGGRGLLYEQMVSQMGSYFWWRRGLLIRYVTYWKRIFPIVSGYRNSVFRFACYHLAQTKCSLPIKVVTGRFSMQKCTHNLLISTDFETYDINEKSETTTCAMSVQSQETTKNIKMRKQPKSHSWAKDLKNEC